MSTTSEPTGRSSPYGLEQTADSTPTVSGAHCAGATGSIPAYDAICLAVTWEKAAAEREEYASKCRKKGYIDEALPLENAAAAYMRCARELTQLAGYPNVRQPESNAIGEARADSATSPHDPTL